MKPHKWSREIKAWADGAEIEWRWNILVDGKSDNWRPVRKENKLSFYEEGIEYRIKPQPKEPQYLYAWENQSTGEFRLGENEPHRLKEYVSQWKCIGKIKLEQDDE